MSTPSRRDLKSAEPLIAALLKIHQTADLEQVAGWGRALGRLFGRLYPGLVPSLAHASRVLADEFLRSQRERARLAKQLKLLRRASESEA